MNHLVPILVIAAKLELKIISSGGKYKNSYFNAQENDQKKAETAGIGPLKEENYAGRFICKACHQRALTGHKTLGG